MSSYLRPDPAVRSWPGRQKSLLKKILQEAQAATPATMRPYSSRYLVSWFLSAVMAILLLGCCVPRSLGSQRAADCGMQQYVARTSGGQKQPDASWYALQEEGSQYAQDRCCQHGVSCKKRSRPAQRAMRTPYQTACHCLHKPGWF